MNSTHKYYNKNAEEYCLSTINLDMSDIYNKFLPLLPKGAKILDAGCGSGRDSKRFIDMGYEVVSFDASQKLVNWASQHTEQTVYKLNFEDMDFSGEFDGIWACASLLHVDRKKLQSVFCKFSKALKPNGVWYMSFKQGTSERQHKDRFFNDQTEESLKEVLVGIPDIKIIEMWPTNDRRPSCKDIWLNCLVRKR